MAVPLAYLQSLASTFSAVREGPQQTSPGTPVEVKLVPASVSDLRVTDMLDAAFNLTWINKNVRFNTHTIEPALTADPFNPTTIDSLLTGGMPARVPVVGNLVGTENLPGTPGEIAQLAGSLPIPVEVPVGLSVAWQVLDSDGTTPLAEGTSTFTAPSGTTSPEVVFIFAPQTVELTNTLTVPVTRRYIRATVTLTAGSTTHTFTLPDIPIDIPAIAIPTVIVYFMHSNFGANSGDDEGAAFIVVPNNSPLHSVSELQSVLNTLEATISSVTSVAELAAFLLGLSALTSALSAQPHVQFRVADSSNDIDNFNDVTLIQRSWYENDTEAEDELSSLIFIGPVRKQVQCFNDRDQDSGEGQFDLTIGSKLHVIVRNLHSAAPVSEPGGTEIAIVASPPGGWFNPDTFGDELSSLHFQ